MSNNGKESFDIERLSQKYGEIYTILSPPRCVSTAFSRIFWEQPTIGFYSHEPFETTYFWNEGLAEVFNKLMNPLDVRPYKNTPDRKDQKLGLVVKEMPYQVGNNFDLLVRMSEKPMVVLVRDPRLSIASRMRKRQERGSSITYPLVETGWGLLVKQIKQLEDMGREYMIVDTTEFRESPSGIIKQVFEKLDLPFDESMLKWKPAERADIDNLLGPHRNQYERALRSTGVEAPTEKVPDINWFPEEGGFREHVGWAMGVYESLLLSPLRIRKRPGNGQI